MVIHSNKISLLDCPDQANFRGHHLDINGLDLNHVKIARQTNQVSTGNDHDYKWLHCTKLTDDIHRMRSSIRHRRFRSLPVNYKRTKSVTQLKRYDINTHIVHELGIFRGPTNLHNATRDQRRLIVPDTFRGLKCTTNLTDMTVKI